MSNKWESYWSTLTGGKGEAPWDSEPEHKAARHAPILQTYFDDDLPFVDFGCGNGTQASYFATLFQRTIGLDVADSAVASARAAHPAVPGLEFRTLNVLDTAAVETLHDELGDANVYEDTMLHTLPGESQQTAIANLARLTGRTGRMFILELAPHGANLVADARKNLPADLPKLRRVFETGIELSSLTGADIETLVKRCGLNVLGAGSESILSTEVAPGGQRISVPTHWTVAGY